MKKKNTCIVTGGAGFIGSHLIKNLIKRGYFVYCIDNLLTGTRQNIKDLFTNPFFRFFESDLIKDSLNFIKDKKVDSIFHLASPASPPLYRRFSIETLLVNSIGTYRMLEIAVKNNSRFLLASTSEVYGDPKEHPQKETYYGHVNPVGLRACYDESKRFAEAITMEYHRKFKIDVRIVRIFNTYGPNMKVDDGRVISNFVTQAIKGKPLTIYGAGTQTRSFCFVSDMVDGIIAAIESKSAANKIINLGNPSELTIRELAGLVLELTKSSSKIVKLDKRLSDDPEKRKPDISEAGRLLNFEPKVNLEEGLKKTIAYFKSL